MILTLKVDARFWDLPAQSLQLIPRPPLPRAVFFGRHGHDIRPSEGRRILDIVVTGHVLGYDSDIVGLVL